MKNGEWRMENEELLWRCRIVGVVGDSATRWWAVAADGCGCGGMVVALWGLRTAGQPRQGLKLGRRRPCEGPKSLSWDSYISREHTYLYG